ncbi:enoyl-CoA hydratase/isomerase family protein [Celeribacter marinus]|uniref:enoyl-CoA hydratase/isomerase family protein n=1 Tax=Celeribacter marinus TaxID=1397108 RepID=UPI003F6B745F
MTQVVKLRQNGSVATLTLNRPASYNAFDAQMRRDFAEMLRVVEADTSIRVVVIAGSGRGFCAGADLKFPSTKTSGDVLEQEFRPCLEPIWNSTKLYIAAVHGHAAGIGAALVLACDLVVMEADAKLTLAFAAIGLIPDGGLCWHLTHTLGPRRALEAIVQGQSLDATLCFERGLTNKVVDAGGALAAAQEWAKTIAEAAPLALVAAKKLVAQAMQVDIDAVFSQEAEVQTHLAQSNDHARGLAAFMARETPVFRGD